MVLYAGKLCKTFSRNTISSRAHNFAQLPCVVFTHIRRRLRCHKIQFYSSEPVSEDEKEKELERIAKDASIDEPPTACCRSGCSNCVFIVWAEAVANKMQNSGPEITEKILKMVDDPSMKAYLEMELRFKGIKK